MKQSENHIDRTWAEERIEAYTDDVLSREEKKAFERLMHADDDLAQQVNIARQVRTGLGDLPLPQCPPAAYEHVLNLARRHASAGNEVKRSGWLSGVMQPRRRPALAIVVASAVVAAVMTTMVLYRGADSPQNAGEVDAALRDVKLALSYVSLAGRETGSAIRLQAVDQTMVVPIRRALMQGAIGRVENLETESGAADRDRAKRGES